MRQLKCHHFPSVFSLSRASNPPTSRWNTTGRITVKKPRASTWLPIFSIGKMKQSKNRHEDPRASPSSSKEHGPSRSQGPTEEWSHRGRWFRLRRRWSEEKRGFLCLFLPFPSLLSFLLLSSLWALFRAPTFSQKNVLNTIKILVRYRLIAWSKDNIALWFEIYSLKP